jgi:hypothetical protein
LIVQKRGIMKVEHIICYLIEIRQLEKKLAEIKIQWDMDADSRFLRHYRPLAAKFDPEHEKKIQDEYNNHKKKVDKLENRIQYIDDLLYNFMQTNENK